MWVLQREDTLFSEAPAYEQNMPHPGNPVSYQIYSSRNSPPFFNNIVVNTLNAGATRGGQRILWHWGVSGLCCGCPPLPATHSLLPLKRINHHPSSTTPEDANVHCETHQIRADGTLWKADQQWSNKSTHLYNTIRWDAQTVAQRPEHSTESPHCSRFVTSSNQFHLNCSLSDACTRG